MYVQEEDNGEIDVRNNYTMITIFTDAVSK